MTVVLPGDPVDLVDLVDPVVQVDPVDLVDLVVLVDPVDRSVMKRALRKDHHLGMVRSHRRLILHVEHQPRLVEMTRHRQPLQRDLSKRS